MNRNGSDKYDTHDSVKRRRGTGQESIGLALKRMDLSAKRIGSILDEKTKFNEFDQANKILKVN